MTYEVTGETPTRLVAQPWSGSVNRTDRWTMTLGERQGSQELVVVLGRDDTCNDGMSDETFEFRVDVLGSRAGMLSGCCRASGSDSRDATEP